VGFPVTGREKVTQLAAFDDARLQDFRDVLDRMRVKNDPPPNRESRSLARRT
jgi:hypothetical protein